MAKISKEAREMYAIFQDVGDWGDVNGMTGDYDSDIDSFAAQWKEIKNKIKQLKVDTDTL